MKNIKKKRKSRFEHRTYKISTYEIHRLDNAIALSLLSKRNRDETCAATVSLTVLRREGRWQPRESVVSDTRLATGPATMLDLHEESSPCLPNRRSYGRTGYADE